MRIILLPSNRLAGRSNAPTAAHPAAEAGIEIAWSTTLALLASITAAVAVTVTASATAARAALAVVAEHAARWSVRAALVDVRLRNNLGRQVQVLAEIVETLGGQRVVEVLPREARFKVAARREGLACASSEMLCARFRPSQRNLHALMTWRLLVSISGCFSRL